MFKMHGSPPWFTNCLLSTCPNSFKCPRSGQQGTRREIWERLVARTLRHTRCTKWKSILRSAMTFEFAINPCPWSISVMSSPSNTKKLLEAFCFPNDSRSCKRTLPYMKKTGVLILTKTTRVGSNCLSRFFVSVVPKMASLISILTMHSVDLSLSAEAVSSKWFCKLRNAWPDRMHLLVCRSSTLCVD